MPQCVHETEPDYLEIGAESKHVVAQGAGCRIGFVDRLTAANNSWPGMSRCVGQHLPRPFYKTLTWEADQQPS